MFVQVSCNLLLFHVALFLSDGLQCYSCIHLTDISVSVPRNPSLEGPMKDVLDAIKDNACAARDATASMPNDTCSVTSGIDPVCITSDMRIRQYLTFTPEGQTQQGNQLNVKQAYICTFYEVFFWRGALFCVPEIKL